MSVLVMSGVASVVIQKIDAYSRGDDMHCIELKCHDEAIITTIMRVRYLSRQAYSNAISVGHLQTLEVENNLFEQGGLSSRLDKHKQAAICSSPNWFCSGAEA